MTVFKNDFFFYLFTTKKKKRKSTFSWNLLRLDEQRRDQELEEESISFQ